MRACIHKIPTVARKLRGNPRRNILKKVGLKTPYWEHRSVVCGKECDLLVLIVIFPSVRMFTIQVVDEEDEYRLGLAPSVRAPGISEPGCQPVRTWFMITYGPLYPP